MANYYNEKVMKKFTAALSKYVDMVKRGENLRVTISDSNSKMGAVASVSTLPFVTCPNRCKDTCGANCYAAKIANMRTNVLNSYAKNTAIAMFNPSLFWAEVDTACKAVRYFRFHVSGDILNYDYFCKMIETARNNEKTEILCFTKRYEIVNKWIDENGKLPNNLHVLFSGWSNLKTINPHNIAETNVFSKEDEIRDKIDEYMESIKELPWWEEEREYRCMVIDALLWVIGDESGKAI